MAWADGWASSLGLVLVLAALLSYLGMLFVAHRFTYKTWTFDGLAGVGIALAIAGWIAGEAPTVPIVTLVLGISWFVISRRELRLSGSNELLAHVGKPLPEFAASTVTGKPVTGQDLLAAAPTLLVLYRGWWCPSSKAQLGELIAAHEELAEAGLTIFAGSVDSPAESAPMQEYVGDSITILCNVPESFLDEVGVRDSRGAPWYDRALFGAAERAIAMPTALVVERSGRVVFAYRAKSVDDRAAPALILNAIKV